MTDREFQLDELPDDALKAIIQQLSTYTRRDLCLVSRKWRRLIAESWNTIAISLQGANYLDSASFQLKWLLSLQLQQLQKLTLALKGVELTGIEVDYLLGPLLDVLEQGGFPQLQTLYLAADMSLPGPLCHNKLQSLILDVYALTAFIKCPQLVELSLCAVSMPGPTWFSEEALKPLQQLTKLQLSFHACFLDDPNASWFVTDGLSYLSALQHAVITLPRSVNVAMLRQPVFPTQLSHLELYCYELVLRVDAVKALITVPNLYIQHKSLTLPAGGHDLGTLQDLLSVLDTKIAKFVPGGWSQCHIDIQP